MKLPPHITLEDKKEIAKLFHTTRQKYGINDALLLEKMALVAAYGTMISGKITFQEFIRELYYHIALGGNPMTHFWGFHSQRRVENDKLFNIPYKLIKYGNKNELESTIYDTVKNCHWIKTSFQEYVKKFL